MRDLLLAHADCALLFLHHRCCAFPDFSNRCKSFHATRAQHPKSLFVLLTAGQVTPLETSLAVRSHPPCEPPPASGALAFRMDKPLPLPDIIPPPKDTWLPPIEPPLGEWIHHELASGSHKSWELRCHPVFEARIGRGAKLYLLIINGQQFGQMAQIEARLLA